MSERCRCGHLNESCTRGQGEWWPTPSRDAATEPSTEAGRVFVEAVSKALLDPSLASFFSGTGRPQPVAIVHIDAIRDAILAIEAEARAASVPPALDESRTTLTPEQVCSRLSAWADAAGVASPRCGTGALAVWKSDLLSRLIFGKEKGPSQTPCPVHEGRWSGLMFNDPERPDSRIAEWREKGCRCDGHNGSGAFTGWNPDAACGCIDHDAAETPEPSE